MFECLSVRRYNQDTITRKERVSVRTKKGDIEKESERRRKVSRLAMNMLRVLLSCPSVYFENPYLPNFVVKKS